MKRAMLFVLLVNGVFLAYSQDLDQSALSSKSATVERNAELSDQLKQLRELLLIPTQQTVHKKAIDLLQKVTKDAEQEDLNGRVFSEPVKEALLHSQKKISHETGLSESDLLRLIKLEVSSAN